MIEREIIVWEIGIPQWGRMETLLWSDENGYNLETREYEIKAGKIQIQLPKTCGVILKYKAACEENTCKNDTM